MDPDKIVSFVSNNLANQTSGIVATLYHPRVIFEPVRPAVGAVAVVGGGTVTPGAMIEKPAPEVFVFFAINLLLGTAINKLIPGRKEAPDIIPTLCVSYGIALMAGFLLHLFSRALGGRGTFWMKIGRAHV